MRCKLRGKRGKYHQWITKEGLTKIEGWARDGLTNEQIAKNIGINPDTLYTWIKKFPEISESLKKGKEVVDREVENALLKRALGYEYEEVKTYIEEVDGKRKKKVEKTIKHVPADVTAGIFWLKNRKPEQWRNKDVIDVEKAKADIEFTKQRTKLIKGEKKDTSMLEALIEGRQQYEQMMKEREDNEQD